MTVYVVYILDGYTRAVAMSASKDEAETCMREFRAKGVHSWIARIDVSKDSVTEIDIDRN